MTPPKYLVLRRKLIANAPQNAAKHRKTPQNTAKCRKTPQNTAKHRKTPQNTAKHRKTPQNATNALTVVANLLLNAANHRQTPPNTAKHRKAPQNIAKHHKYCELAISLCGTKYLGGLKKPAHFSGLLKLIVDHNWGATAPFPP